MFFRVCTSFNLLCMYYVLWFRCHYKWEREDARGKNNDLSHVPSKGTEEIKSGTSGCGSFVVPYFQPATSSTDHLHVVLSSCRRREKKIEKREFSQTLVKSTSFTDTLTMQCTSWKLFIYIYFFLNDLCHTSFQFLCPPCTPFGNKSHTIITIIKDIIMHSVRHIQ